MNEEFGFPNSVLEETGEDFSELSEAVSQSDSTDYLTIPAPIAPGQTFWCVPPL